MSNLPLALRTASRYNEHIKDEKEEKA